MEPGAAPPLESQPDPRGGSWWGLLAVAYGAAALAVQGLVLTAVLQVGPALRRAAATLALRTEEEGASGIEEPLVEAVFEGWDLVEGPFVAAAGVGTALALLTVVAGLGLVHGREGWRRVLRLVLGLGFLRSLAWTLCLALLLAPAARAWSVRLDGAVADLQRKVGNVPSTEGIVDVVESVTSSAGTVVVANLHLALLLGLWLLAGSRKARAWCASRAPA